MLTKTKDCKKIFLKHLHKKGKKEYVQEKWKMKENKEII